MTLCLLFAFKERYPWVFTLDLAGVDALSKRDGYFSGFFLLFSGTASLFMAVGFARYGSSVAGRRLLRFIGRGGPDAPWVIAATLIAVVLPGAIAILVVHGANLTNGMTTHLFTARLLVDHGAVSWPIELMPKDHFDHPQLVMRENVYAEPSIGWAVLLAPGVWLGVSHLMAPIYAGTAVFPVYQIAKRTMGGTWLPRLAMGFYAFSPMLVFAAASGMEHTAAFVTVVWMHWAVLCAADEPRRFGFSLAVLLLFLLALATRPQPALGLGLPLLLHWFLNAIRASRKAALTAALSLAMGALGALALFWAVNIAQSGHPWIPSEAGHFIPRTGSVKTWEVWGDLFKHELEVPSGEELLARWGMAYHRLNMSLWGWPISLLFVPFGLIAREGRLAAILLLTGTISASFKKEAGIDIFGPENYFHLAWPLLLLSVLGVQKLRHHASRVASANALEIEILPPAAALAMTFTGVPCYWLPRLDALERMSTEAAYTVHMVEERSGLSHVVVFGPTHYLPKNCDREVQSWIIDPPVNQPEFTDNVVWATNRGYHWNTELMARFPDRPGYVAQWRDGCDLELRPLHAASPRKTIHISGKL